MDQAQQATSNKGVKDTVLPTGSSPQTSKVRKQTIDVSSVSHPEVKAGLAPRSPALPAGRLGEGGPVRPEVAQIEVRPETPEISPEIAEHVERVAKGEVELPGPIKLGEFKGKPVTIEPPAPQQPNIVLPVTQDDLQTGQKSPITSAFRWLVEWVKWIIKKYPGRVLYRNA